MGRGIKILLAAAGLLALLAVAGVVLVYVLVDPNDYKPEIVRLVKEQTGRDLVLEGDLGLSLFPGLSVTLGPARLGNAPGFGDRPFAVLKGASARLAIRPLIDGRVEVSHVRLDGLVLNLERDAQGRTNWDDLLAAGPGAPKAGADKAGAGAGQAGPEKGPGLALSVDAIRIKDASVSWTEAEGGQVYRVDGVDLAVTNFAAGRSFDFTMSLGFAAKDPAIDGRAEVQGSAVLDPERDAYLVKGLKAEVRAKGGDLPGGRAEVLLGAADLRLDLARQLASLEGLSLSAYGLSARGKAVVSGFRDRVSAKGALEIPSFEPRQVLASLGVEGLRTADPEALSRAAAAVDFKASFDEFEASSLLVRVDASTVQGQGRITNFKNPIYALKARVDYLDLDRYLPPQEQAEARSGQSRSGQSRSGSGVGSSGPQEREIIPVKLLRGLRLDADLSAAELKAFGLRMSDVVLRVHALDGRVDVKALNMDLYQGRVESSAGVDCRGQRPETKLEIKADKVEAGPLVRDAT
ncbi:MAG: AsmA family protein, partial [Desulfovibrionaceae bacterium]|nr:AsmA family protein [Desulfovibrionaceae bacterium]